jgi:hypothetical protein
MEIFQTYNMPKNLRIDISLARDLRDSEYIRNSNLQEQKHE